MNEPQDGQTQERLAYIDIFRAFGIFLMIMGHVGFGGIFDKWIHIFHMPMFFIISGFFFKDKTFSQLLKKRAKTLLVPYIAFGLLHLIIYFIRIKSIDIHAFYLFFWENTAENGIPIAGALWFLTAMFFSEVFFWTIHQFHFSEIIKTCIVTVLAVIGMTCAVYLPFRLPLAIDVGMVGVGFFQIGKLIRTRWAIVLKVRSVFSLVGIIAFSALGFLNGYINLRKGEYAIWPLFWINAIGMSISFWNIIGNIYSWLSGLKGIFKKSIDWFRSVGQDSIVFLCLNQLAILLSGDIASLLLPTNRAIILLAKKTMILIIAMIELCIMQKIVMKTKLRVLIGKW